MKEVTKYLDEETKRVYDTKKEALISENRNKDIRKSFSFYQPDDNIEFLNGKYCYKQNEDYYMTLIETLIFLIKKYYLKICKDYDQRGGLQPIHIMGQSFIGRYLDSTDLYEWWVTQGNICKKCYREYGQMSFAIHCECDDSIPELSKFNNA